jgi:hypothetical protein
MRSKRWTSWHSYITPSPPNPWFLVIQKLKEDHVLEQVSQRLPLGYDTIIFPDITSLGSPVL